MSIDVVTGLESPSSDLGDLYRVQRTGKPVRWSWWSDVNDAVGHLAQVDSANARPTSHLIRATTCSRVFGVIGYERETDAGDSKNVGTEVICEVTNWESVVPDAQWYALALLAAVRV